MLEYQELDIELNKLKKANVNSADRNNMAKLKEYILDEQGKRVKLEADAKDLLNDYAKLKKQYDVNIDKIQKLTSTDLNAVSLDSVDEILATINGLSSELFQLERTINNIINKIKESLKSFDIAKKNIQKAKSKYDIYKTQYEKGIKDSMPKIKEIEARMLELEKTLNPELFAKYKALKAEKIFPVFVTMVGGHCSGCRVEIPTAKANKLKTEKTIVCECHRIIYSTEK